MRIITRKYIINWNDTRTPQIAVIEFEDFEVENSVQCRYDSLTIHTGTDENAPILRKLCGSNVPNDIRGISNELFVVFYSDHSVRKRGFRAIYSAKEPIGKFSWANVSFHFQNILRLDYLLTFQTKQIIPVNVECPKSLKRLLRLLEVKLQRLTAGLGWSLCRKGPHILVTTGGCGVEDLLYLQLGYLLQLTVWIQKGKNSMFILWCGNVLKFIIFTDI